MNRADLLSLAVLVAVAQLAAAQIPPGYEIIQVTENPYFERGAQINNHGQIVFGARAGDHDEAYEVFLYDDGELIRLTDDNVADQYPGINDDGTIVWSRAIGDDGPFGPTYEVVLWQGGELTRLTEDGLDDQGPRINNLGHVVWGKWVGGGCADANCVICFYDGNTIRQISDAEWSHQSAEINDQDWIVWTRYDFCPEPWESAIMLYRDESITQISLPETVGAQMPTINNRGQVAWQFEVWRGDKGIQLWEDGEVTLFTNWGMNVRLNDHGDMYFIRWYEEDYTYQAWLYLRGRLYQLSDDPFWNTDGDINNAGECVWGSGDYPWTDIRLLRRMAPAHADASAKVDPCDIRPVRP